MPKGRSVCKTKGNNTQQMAKVTGPLYSMSASGKIANALVFFGWKGINVVREWVIPANPKTALQGNIRMIFANLGRAASAAKETSLFRRDARAVTATGSTWVADFVGHAMRNYVKDADSFAIFAAAFEAHLQKETFESAARGRGIIGIDIVYDGIPTLFTPGMQFYALARYGFDKRGVVTGAFQRDPYTFAVDNWTTSLVNSFVGDLGF